MSRLVIGVLVALALSSAALRVGLVLHQAGAEPLAFTERILEKATFMVGISAAETASFERALRAHPAVIGTHASAAFLFMVLLPLQFSDRLRGRFLSFHRWSGRFLLASGLVLTLTGLFFGLLMPFGGRTEATGVAAIAALFLWSLVRAVRAIRRGDVTSHREWMTRAFGAALAVAVMRVVLNAWVLGGHRVQDVFGASVWAGLVLSAGAAEVLVQRRRRREVAFRPDTVLAPGRKVA